jgi:hypothetical protein
VGEAVADASEAPVELGVADPEGVGLSNSSAVTLKQGTCVVKSFAATKVCGWNEHGAYIMESVFVQVHTTSAQAKKD